MVSIKRTIDARLLNVFVTVAARNGISAAAEELGIAKSAVSKQLEALEDMLQVRLFERTSRRVSLTQEGLGLLPKAQSILAELDQFILDAQERQAQVRGTVRVAASPEFGAFLTEHFLPRLLHYYPTLKVLLSLEYRLDDLQDPEFDLAFRLGKIGDDRFIARHLGDFVRVFVCSPHYQDAGKVSVPDDLAKINALMFSQRELTTHWALQNVAKPHQQYDVEVKGNLAAHGFGALAAAAVAGMGVANLPSFLAATGLHDGRLIRLLAEWSSPPVPVHIVYRSGMSRVGRINAVIKTALAEIPSLLAHDTGLPANFPISQG